MLKKKYFFVAIFWTIVVTTLSLTSADNVPEVRIPNIDKVVHFVFYFLFTVFWYLSYRGNDLSSINKRALYISGISAFLYGILMEIFQQLYAVNRTADIEDVVANTIGALSAILLTSCYYRLKKTK